ncbi:ABC transporter substrate-binding protein [Pigmentiphaga kullae]|uniref:Amino acid/amide ABC transporter substrate-binding protein (HAAT family) n=1 Tax=Pigmentiphaga kullae TaxID=151784 RepID=A0A4Q7NJE2_9BURK|nr:ABC transporter substrate-binding protein [Pigmentiphaga kullae]RZS85184.1 amino acid/amide ABC transporter substrate-binding protein (HAAT family) [Pigmentiphaga kullae]
MKIRLWGCVLGMALGGTAAAQTPLKIGFVGEMSGQQAEYGLQMSNGAKLFLQEHGDVVAGRKIQLIIKDVGGPNPEVAKRVAQELITRDKVEFLAGFGFTPNALAVAPLATEAKIPMVVMNAATSSITERSPYVVRTSMTLPQNAYAIADWALKNNVKTVYSLYADYGPGQDANAQFRKTFTGGGGKIVAEVAVPLKNPEFGPYMQRIKDAKPDAAFLWFPSGELSVLMLRAYRERGLEQAGIKALGTGDGTDDMFLDSMGDVALGLTTSFHYSAAHDSAKNKAFIKGYESQFGTSIRPNFMAVGGYDGMALIYETIKKLNGKIDGTKAVEAMKGAKWESPRGPVMIDPETRDIVQNIYIRKVERRGNHLYNVEFSHLDAVKDPGKAK